MSCGVEKRKEALFLSPEASRRHHFQATLSSHVIARSKVKREMKQPERTGRLMKQIAAQNPEEKGKARRRKKKKKKKK